MKYTQAVKLHNEDEVTLKRDGVIHTVNSIEIFPKEKIVMFALVNNDNGNYIQATHTEVS